MSDINKGLELYKEGKFEEALAVFNQLMEQDSAPALRIHRARILSRLGKLEEALADFDVLVQLEAYNANYISDRAVVLHLLKRNDEALSELDRALNLDPANPYRYSSRAFLKDRMGDLEGAIADYDTAIEMDPEDAVSYNNKGLVEEKLGYKERSQQSFEKADKLVGYEPKKAENTDPAISGAPKEKSTSTPSQLLNQEANLSNKVSFGGYWNMFGKIINDKNTRSEFFDFIQSKFGKQK
ncbi:hypothetical protein GCM10007049_28180 [Echinicola pacifica]|uniref:Tetratricopeptide repeat protein n=1 Tax=Echinicola pacifica TaxID=346377 RepID=A0A918Q3U8_9BACT|nr:tetratricopeptide repeat protein [Echinicola pacifica]GGZ32915.1 hypothetical protein GCM10007049_28180 [Echinicola pacifica]